jgi:hypothetical protein
MMVELFDAMLSAAPTPQPAIKTLPEVIAGLTSWVVGILAGVATLFLTIGGLRYLAAGGDPAEVERAKTSLRSALIGYALAVLAPVLLDIVQGIVGR